MSEESLVSAAAVTCLKNLRTLEHVSAASTLVRSGGDVIRVRVSIIKDPLPAKPTRYLYCRGCQKAVDPSEVHLTNRFIGGHHYHDRSKGGCGFVVEDTEIQ